MVKHGYGKARRYFRCGFICCIFGAVQFLNVLIVSLLCDSRKENPQKLTQLSSRSHPRHLVEKRTAQKDTIIDITSDSQVNSNFPYRWSPATLTFNNLFNSVKVTELPTVWERAVNSAYHLSFCCLLRYVRPSFPLVCWISFGF